MGQGRRVIAALGAMMLTLCFAQPAQAQFKRCAKGVAAQCGDVSVPLDRSGAVRGTVKLSVLRVPARRGPRAGTVMMLPGGPGQGAAELSVLALGLSAELPRHEIVVFDPRGTGDSGELRCKALRRDGSTARCARELGARRGYYRSYDTSEDIEAVRAAIGSPKLTLYSISYGARVAGEYVRRHPDAVERQIMDSPSAITGTDPFSREVLASQPRVLDTLQRGGARSVARLATRLARRPLRGTAYTSRGRAVRGRAAQAELFVALVSADLDPVLRGQIPAAARAALRGDAAPLLRLTRGLAAGDGEDTSLSVPTFLATSCSEAPLPWDTSQPPSPTGRARQLRAALTSLGRRPFAPFAPLNVVAAGGLVTDCANWPAVPKAPPLPAGSETSGVPTLLISGAEDTRTPLEQTTAIANTYSSRQVLTVPFTGHSVLGTDLSTCTANALTRYIARGVAPARCAARRRPLETPVVRAFPRTLRSLDGSLRARSFAAGPLTVADAVRQLNSSSASLRVGGLRGGTARVRRRALELRGYEFLSGVRVSGRLRVGSGGRLTGRIRIRGGGALPVLQTFKRALLTNRRAGTARVDGPVRLPALKPVKRPLSALRPAAAGREPRAPE